MASSISQQLEDLLNPLPKFTDPEDDQDEATKAKVIEKFDEGDEEDGYTSFTGLKKRSIHILEETDRRYAGKATSRKELQKLLLAGSDEGEEEDDDVDDEGGDSDELDDDHEDEEEEEEDMEEEDDEGMDSDEDSPMKNKSSTRLKSDDASFPKVTDFHKLTEGMDDLGMSEEDEDGGSGEEDEESSEGEEDDEEVDDDDVEEEEDDAVMTFSKEKVDEEVEKGKCVKNQLALWDQLLEGRIKIQKALATANQLPQPQTFPEFKTKGGAQFSGALKNSHKALKALQRSLLDLQDLLLLQSTETRPIAQGKAWSAESKRKAVEDSDLDEEIESEEDEDEDGDEGEDKKGVRNRGPPKRKLEMSEYPDYMAKRFANFEPYRSSTLQKWYDKTRLTMGKTTKGFGSFDRNILTQVEHVLMDKERLVRRTQTRRSQFRVLGKPEITAPVLEPATTEKEEVERAVLKANAHLKDLDEEIFDDSDFYHQLLRELIERKTSAADPNDQVAMGRQWLAIQKLRSKIKKKVDTKASKGRKIRFHIHSKLVNFMAPVDHSSMHDEARTELYRSLFGGNTLTGAPQHEGQ